MKRHKTSDNVICTWRCRHFTLKLFIIFLLCASVQAAPDDIEGAAEKLPPANRHFVIDDNSVEANVFQPYGTKKQAQTSIKTRLKLRVDELDRICNLTEAQKKKLELAASNDVRRFFDEYDLIRKKYKTGILDQQGWNNFWQEIQPLRTKMSAGLFGDSSFFAKSTRSILKDDQFAKFEEVVRERQRYRYRACIEFVMETVESSVPLRADQHDAIVKLILEDTSPPLAFGQHDQQVVLYNLTKIAEEKFQLILDEKQGRQIKTLINQYRAWGQWLVDQGLIPQEDQEEKKKKPRVRRQIKRANAVDGPADAGRPVNEKSEP